MYPPDEYPRFLYLYVCDYCKKSTTNFNSTKKHQERMHSSRPISIEIRKFNITPAYDDIDEIINSKMTLESDLFPRINYIEDNFEKMREMISSWESFDDMMMGFFKITLLDNEEFKSILFRETTEKFYILKSNGDCVVTQDTDILREHIFRYLDQLISVMAVHINRRSNRSQYTNFPAPVVEYIMDTITLTDPFSDNVNGRYSIEAFVNTNLIEMIDLIKTHCKI